MAEKERVLVLEEEEEEVWSWGAGTDGQLGTGKLQDEHLPIQLQTGAAAGGGPISLLSCGGAHVIALTTGGRVVAWGRGNYGQLGHGDTVNSLQPKPVEFFEGFVVTHVSAGWNHSGFVTRHVEQIACGMRHSLVLLEGHSGDNVYGFGSGKRGQLGISEDKVGSICLPQTTIGLEDANISRINANGDHSVALSAEGCLYTWGRGFSGGSDVNCPQRLSSSLSFTQMALGWNHALLLTSKGEVYMLGGKHHGWLSESQRMNPAKRLSEGSKEVDLGEIPGLSGIEVLQIAAGAEHSALVTENGLVMTWGWGEHGQLGLGSTVDQTSPQVVKLEDKPPTMHTRTEVFCGSGFTFAVRHLK